MGLKIPAWLTWEWLLRQAGYVLAGAAGALLALWISGGHASVPNAIELALALSAVHFGLPVPIATALLYVLAALVAGPFALAAARAGAQGARDAAEKQALGVIRAAMDSKQLALNEENKRREELEKKATDATFRVLSGLLMRMVTAMLGSVDYAAGHYSDEDLKRLRVLVDKLDDDRFIPVTTPEQARQYYAVQLDVELTVEHVERAATVRIAARPDAEQMQALKSLHEQLVKTLDQIARLFDLLSDLPGKERAELQARKARKRLKDHDAKDDNEEGNAPVPA